MSTVSLADHSLHVCSCQALLCARLAACHVPLPLVLNHNHGTSCDEVQWAYSGTPRRCIRQRRMANTIRSSCSMPWATRLYTVWEEGRSQLVSCLLHTYPYMHMHTHHTTLHIPSPHTPGTGRGWWCSVSCHGQPFPSGWGFHSEPPGIYPGRTAGSTGIGSTPVGERNPSYSRQAYSSNFKPCPWTYWCMWFLRYAWLSYASDACVLYDSKKEITSSCRADNCVIQVQEYICIHLHKSK